MNRKFLFALLAVLLVFLPACKSLNQVTPESMDEEAMEIEVRAKMAEDIDLKAFEIKVDVRDGVVYLDGHVDNMEQKRKAGQAANDVKGVKSVVNNLHTN